MSKNIPIVIPSYEPDERFLSLLKDLEETLDSPIIIVNDGSEESYNKYFDVAKNVCEKSGGAYLSYKKNSGKGYALKTAFSYILKEMPEALGCVTADSDGQHSAECIEKVQQALTLSPDALVLGVRDFDLDQVPWKSKFGNKITAIVFKFTTGEYVSDTQTGLRGIPRKFMDDLVNFKSERFEFEIEMLQEAVGKFPFKEVVIKTIYDSKENHQTHFNTVKDSIKIYKVLFRKFGRYIINALTSMIIEVILYKVFCPIAKPYFVLHYMFFANLWARILSSIYNFIVNKYFVFKSKKNTSSSLIKYVCLVCVNLLVSSFCIDYFSRLLGLEGNVLVKIVIDSIIFFINYFISQKYIY